MGKELESVDGAGFVDSEDDGGGMGAVGCGRLEYTCNGVGAVKGRGTMKV